MGALVAIAAAGVAVSAGSAIASASSGGGGGGGGVGTYGGSPYTYIPSFQSTADPNLSALESTLYSQDTANEPQQMAQYKQQTDNLLNNPYAAGAQQSANNIAALGVPIANASFAGAQNLQSMGDKLSPYAGQILETGFDPQHALYDRTQAQLSDQVSARNAMSGLSGSPYGAGVANEAMKNFNIDWQNTQLGRESQALQGYGSAISSTGAAYGGAQGLADQGLSTLQTTGQLPYQVYLGQGQNNLAALNSQAAGYTASQQPMQNLINNYNSYLALGQSATQQAMAGQNQAFNQGQTVGNNIGQGLSGLVDSAGGLIKAFNSQPAAPTSYGGSGVTTGYNPTNYDYYSNSSGDLMAA